MRWDYVDGEYQILVRSTGQFGHATSHFVCLDCAVEVDVRFASEAQAWLGIAFGIIGDYETYYLFRVSASQYYSLYERADAAWNTLIPWTQSAHVNPGQEVNHLRVERTGANIALYVNGHYLQTVIGSIHVGSPEVGVTASADTVPNVDARFDNFVVYGVGSLAVPGDRSPGVYAGHEEAR